QAEDGIRDRTVTGVQTCALPISRRRPPFPPRSRQAARSARRGSCPRGRERRSRFRRPAARPPGQCPSASRRRTRPRPRRLRRSGRRRFPRRRDSSTAARSARLPHSAVARGSGARGPAPGGLAPCLGFRKTGGRTRPSLDRLLALLALVRLVGGLVPALALLAARVDFFVDLPLGRVAALLVDQLFAARLLLVIAHASSFRNNEGAGRRRLRSLGTGWARRLRSRRPCRRRTPPR